MMNKPVIFISAVSKELRSARDLVAKTLTFLGYDAEWQDIFGTEEGDLKAMLRRKVDVSAGVIQLVGKCYGYEPKVLDSEFGRVSYTQYEALYAKQRGKRVWYLIVGATFTPDAHEPESVEHQQLQRAYTDRVKAKGDLYHPLKDTSALEASVLKLRDELSTLRRRWKQWAALVFGLLVGLVGCTFWVLMEQQKLRSQNDSLLQAIHELPETIGRLSSGGDGVAEVRHAYDVLERKYALQPGSLEKHIPEVITHVLARPDEHDLSLTQRVNSLLETTSSLTESQVRLADLARQIDF